jgi:hypothetical protein
MEPKMKKLINLSTIIMILVGFLSPINATAATSPLWEQLPGGDARVMSFVGNWIVADDFELSSSASIGKIEFWSDIQDPVEVNVKFYANAVSGSGINSPDGDPLYTAIISSTGTLEDSAICSQTYCTYRHTLSLPTPYTFDPGRYWVSIYGTSTLYWSYDSTVVDGSAKAGYWWNNTWGTIVRNLAFRLLEAEISCSETITVMNDEDSGAGSLRQAVIDVCPDGEITFDASLSGSTINLSGQIQINKSLTITGPGADRLAISGSDLELNEPFTPSYDGGVFKLEALWSEELSSYQPILVNISGLTVIGGRAWYGGGIYNGYHCTLELSDCVIGPNNEVTDAGGGLANMGNMTLNRCTVVGNHGTGSIGGAGIFTHNDGEITLINSTVTDNVTNNLGGGILVWYGGIVNLIHSTVSGNLANQDYSEYAYGGGGGVYIQGGASGGVLNIQNSIVAGNEDWTEPSEHQPWPDVFGAANSLGGNLIGDGTGSSGWVAGDRVGTTAAPIDPMLDDLALNAPGSTPTFALQEGSPAIDRAACVEGVDVDQRGVGRPLGFKCDIGSYESEFESIYFNIYLPLIRR